MDCPVLHADSHDTDTLVGVIHDEIRREILDEKVGTEAEGTTVKGVKHGVTLTRESHC